ncbi:MAG: hypothetical protein K0S41_48 [Anaerocolumna sp.]|jgi:hypothetical protein|nr:hypothetical protein [Anaerocolumna sp.]
MNKKRQDLLISLAFFTVIFIVNSLDMDNKALLKKCYVKMLFKKCYVKMLFKKCYIKMLFKKVLR